MLVDDITIAVRSGHGGRGAVAFNKNLMSLGPTGATGGRGGNVVCEGVADISALRHFRYKKEFVAEDGEKGKAQFNDGADGADLVLRVPVGTVIHNLTTGADREISAVGERITIAEGGRGGKGNFHYRSSTNTTPKQFQPGLPGESFTVRLELKLIADVGLVGLPNAGKSSLLNALTRAKSKVANYAFTTLEPHLGAYYELILADIPGIIEGASGGKGLGTKFLRHVERTRVLFHLVSADSDDPVRDYFTIRKELESYNEAFRKKPEHVFLSKYDTVPREAVSEKLRALKKAGVSAAPLSIYDDASLADLMVALNRLKDEKLSSARAEPAAGTAAE